MKKIIILVLILAMFYFSFDTVNATDFNVTCTMSGSTYKCLTGTCSFGDSCLLDACDIAACPSRAHTTNTNDCRFVTPTVVGHDCSCDFEVTSTCQGGLGSCTISGNCSYTCNSGWYNDDGDTTNGCENKEPDWYTPEVNNSNPSIGDVVSFNVNWTDINGAGLNITFLEVNGTGANCDTWGNVTNISLSGTSQWSNLTWTIPSACGNKTIGWRQYANDTANRWNVTSIQTISISVGWLNVTLNEPDPSVYGSSNPRRWYQYNTYTVSANVTCVDGNCGNVFGTVRYNVSSNPDTAISAAGGAQPFYISSITQSRPVGFVEDESGGGQIDNPERGYDLSYNDTTTSSDTAPGDQVGEWSRLNYTYSLGSATSGTLFVTAGYGIEQGGNASVYNFNTGKWVTWFTPTTTTPTTNSTPITTAAGTINVTGHVVVSFFAYKTATVTTGISCFDTYIDSAASTISCDSLNNGDKCQLNWTVNATGSMGDGYKIGVLFNSSSSAVTKNHTNNATVFISGGDLIVTLSTPTPGVTTNVIQNSKFNVIATVKCQNADCGYVYGTSRYNASSVFPDIAISTTETTPFFIDMTKNKRPFDYDILTSGTGQVINPTYAYDNGYDDTTTYADVRAWYSPDVAVVEYTFSLGDAESGILYVKAKNSTTAHIGGEIYVYNYTYGSYDRIATVTNTLTTYTVRLNVTDGFINSAGLAKFRAISSYGEGPPVDVLLYDTYVTANYNPMACGDMSVGDTCTLNWIVNTTGILDSVWKIGVLFNSSYLSVVDNHTNNATIKIILQPNITLKGIALYYYTGNRVNGNVTLIPLENPNERETGTVTNGEWTLEFDLDMNDFEHFLVVIDDDEKIGFNELKLDNSVSVNLSCSVQNISLSGYSIDLNSGNTITSGNVKVSALDTDYTNTTTFTGTWSIDFHPCLIPGRLYTLQILISDDTEKRGEILQKYPAR